MRKIWLIAARLHKEHAILKLSSSQMVFSCLDLILGLFLGSFFGGNWDF